MSEGGAMMMRTQANPFRNRVKRRTGVAMLLVLISLMTATVLTAAYLASRDNSGAIGENIAHASAARWGAASGLDIALSMLETEADWRAAHNNGLLVPSYPLGQCLIDLSISDLENGAPPSADTTYARAFATATANDIEHEASASIIVPVSHVANVDLAEFALFAAGSLELKNRAQLIRWSEAPLSDLRLPISVGTLADHMGAVSLSSSTIAMDSSVWLPPGATANTVSNSSPLEVYGVFMEDAVALPAPPQPVVSGLEWWLLGLNHNTTYVLVNYNLRLTSADVVGSVTMSYTNPLALIIDGDLTIADHSRLRISGSNATIIVHGNLRIEGSGRIDVDSDTNLRIFVGGDVDIRNTGYLGETGGRFSGPNNDGLGHARTSRIHLMSMESGSELDWRIRNSSLVKATLYAPNARVRIANLARLCGRVVAGRIELSEDAVVYYDHALDRRTGYTNLASPIYDSDGRVKSDFANLQSLDPADLAALASSQDIKVRAINRSYGTSPLAAATPPDEATPRPVPVTLNRLAYNTSVLSWEK